MSLPVPDDEGAESEALLRRVEFSSHNQTFRHDDNAAPCRRSGFPGRGAPSSDAAGGRWVPEEQASTSSRLLFSYVGSLIRLGASKHLELEDLWDVASKDDAAVVTSAFEVNMQATHCNKTPHGSMWRSCVKTFGVPFAQAGVLKLVHDTVYLSWPFVLQQLVLHLEQPDPSQAVGAAWALLLFANGVAVPVLINQYFHRLFTVTMHAKTCLIHALYRKALRVPAPAVAEMGSGKVANLQSNDAAKVYNLPQYAHSIWSAPLQLCVIFLGLHFIVGWAPTLAGFLVAVLLIPANTLIGTFQSRCREQLLKATDHRVKIVTEVLAGIKTIKLYAWEGPYLETIREARRAEQRCVVAAQLLEALSSVVYSSATVLVAMAAFGTFVAQGKTLTAAVAFPALAFFDLMEMPMYILPVQILEIISARVALDRMQTFLNTDELPMDEAGDAAGGDEDAIAIVDADFSWTSSTCLHSINLRVPSGKLVMVAGEVGAGKSSLIGAVLGEMQRHNGLVRVRGTVAYTAQDPWIQNGTVEDNIRMGGAMDRARYAAVLSACALGPDLDLLPAGDQTELGENGVTLSGGQRHRVALARACYADADVYLLDDPLSAVDASVGRHLFDACVTGLLAPKTRVLVTHQLQYLERADLVVLMQNGRVTASGTYAELFALGVDFATAAVERGEAGAGDETPGKPGSAALSDTANGASQASSALPEAVKDDAAAGQLVQRESRSTGSVDRNVYMRYLRAWGPGLVLPACYVGGAVVEHCLDTGQNLWLSVWSRASSPAAWSPRDYLAVYFALGFGAIIVHAVESTILVFATIRASSKLHNDLLHKVIRLPMAFFDTQPSGRLVNRFTKDVENCDIEIADKISMFVLCVMWVAFSLLVVVSVTHGAVLFAAVPLFALFRHFQRRYLCTSRELKRLDSIALSPIFSHFGETLSGLLTVRAFRWQGAMLRKNEALLNDSNRAYWPAQVANRWLSIRLEGMGQVLILVTALFVALVVRDAGLAGLALTSAVNLISVLTWSTRTGAELEISMNSVERLLEYHQFDGEAPAIVPENRPNPSWPSKGCIDVRDLYVKYRPELPPVLKGLTFKVNSHEKVGVCGRTGCGKSTLMMTLYRIVEPHSGRILIDGIDTSGIGLWDLRSKLSLVPQDPVIFTGTVRSNLDPFGSAASDLAIWDALRQVGLYQTVSSLEGGLEASLSERGSNLSTGQRQLLCMARALLRNCAILLMDEATSNVDLETDQTIQKTIRSAFGDRTVLTIAHRLKTIWDNDRILVLDAGELLEFAPPSELLARKGAFFRLAADHVDGGLAGTGPGPQDQF